MFSTFNQMFTHRPTNEQFNLGEYDSPAVDKHSRTECKLQKRYLVIKTLRDWIACQSPSDDIDYGNIIFRNRNGSLSRWKSECTCSAGHKLNLILLTIVRNRIVLTLLWRHRTPAKRNDDDELRIRLWVYMDVKTSGSVFRYKWQCELWKSVWCRNLSIFSWCSSSFFPKVRPRIFVCISICHIAARHTQIASIWFHSLNAVWLSSNSMIVNVDRPTWTGVNAETGTGNVVGIHLYRCVAIECVRDTVDLGARDNLVC